MLIGIKIMNRSTNTLRSTLALVARAFAMVLVLSVPVLAVPSIGGDTNVSIIEAPAMPKKGLGFVILISLQRV